MFYTVFLTSPWPRVSQVGSAHPSCFATPVSSLSLEMFEIRVMHNGLPVFWRRGFAPPKTVPDRFQVRSFSVLKRCKFLDAAKCTCNAALKVVPGSKMGSQNRYPWWYIPQKVWSRIRLPYPPRFLDSQRASDTPNWAPKVLPSHRMGALHNQFERDIQSSLATLCFTSYDFVCALMVACL